MSGAQLWGGRFSQGMDKRFAMFNATLPVDQRLLEEDIKVSQAYARALHRAGVIDAQEQNKICDGLKKVYKRFCENPLLMQQATEAGIEDIHSLVETALQKEIGPIALKLNTGRSRNDQVVTDFRLWLLKKIPMLTGAVIELQKALVKSAETFVDAVMPGYTHMQRAQPILWAHYLLAYFEMLSRDRERLIDIRRRTDCLPLGSGALAGNSLAIDRDFLAAELGFASISRNSIDAVSDRDFVLELSSALTIVSMHLSRLAEDLIQFSSQEFGFVEMSDEVSTGSSLMPQKKNPDALELIRGKTGKVYGHHVALLTMMKGLPLAYNKDMAEDKAHLFSSIDTVEQCLVVMTTVVATLKVQTRVMREAAEESEITATEAADYLVRKGASFRDAHHIVGRLVMDAVEKKKRLIDLTLEEFLVRDERFTSDIYEFLTVEHAIKTKSTFGGTAKERVVSSLKASQHNLT